MNLEGLEAIIDLIEMGAMSSNKDIAKNLRSAVAAIKERMSTEDAHSMKLALDALETEGLNAAINAAEVCPRNLRLFAVRCAREVQHLMKDQRSIDALDVAERHARGEATDEELDAAAAAAMAAARAAVAGDASTWDAARAAAWAAAGDAMEAAEAAACAARYARDAAIERQKEIFREVFNNAGEA